MAQAPRSCWTTLHYVSHYVSFHCCCGAGSPIVLDDAVVGLSMRSPTPSLVWPPSAVGDRPSQKTLRVANKARDRARSHEIARDRRGMHCLLIHASPVSTWQGPRDAEVLLSSFTFYFLLYFTLHLAGPEGRGGYVEPARAARRHVSRRGGRSRGRGGAAATKGDSATILTKNKRNPLST